VTVPADLAALPWERWADGRLWRLKHGKHFSGEPQEAIAEAERAAERMGKVVRTLPEVQPPHAYVWVQFADHELPLGEPCPCGHHRLIRHHPEFARCAGCGATIILQTEDPAKKDKEAAKLKKAAAERGLRQSLDGYTDVTIFSTRRSKDDSQEQAYGHGLDQQGRHVLIVVTVPLRDGARIPDPNRPEREPDPDDLAEHLHLVKTWPVEPFADGIDLNALGGTGSVDPDP
jgi:hypothetical protein